MSWLWKGFSWVFIWILVSLIPQVQCLSAQELKGCEAALKDAKEFPQSTIVFTLLLDEISTPAGSSNASISSLLKALRFKVKTNVEQLLWEVNQSTDHQSLPPESFRVIICEGRKPVNPSDIQKDINDFDNKKVIMEIWGVLHVDEAILTHAIIPFYTLKVNNQNPPSVFDNSFPRQSSQTDQKFLKELMESSLPIKIYSAAAVGLKLLQEKQFDSARKYLCMAQSLMCATNAQQVFLAPQMQWKRLEKFVEKMSDEVIAQAKTAATEGKYGGKLGTKDIPLGTPCPGTPCPN